MIPENETILKLLKESFDVHMVVLLERLVFVVVCKCLCRKLTAFYVL
jgi:hypothetical protein